VRRERPSTSNARPFSLKPRHVPSLLPASLPNFIYSLFIRYFGERFTPILREFGLAGEGLTHLQTKAVLYPIWRYHLAVSGKVTPRGGGKKTTPGDGWAMIDANNLAGTFGCGDLSSSSVKRC
jgi:hypothetical protein